MFLGKVPLPLHPVGADADGLGPNCLELADQIAEVTVSTVQPRLMAAG